jgi:uncharacterized membrane protein
MSVTDVHITFAFLTLVMLALTIFVQKLKRRKWHHYLAYITFGLVVATIIIGVVMVLTGS